MLFYGNRGFLPSKNRPEEWYDDNGMLKYDWQDLPLTEAGWLEPELRVEQTYKGNPGDFTEFYYDGISSRQLGIYRTSDGERYNIELHPSIKNKIIEVPNGDGYYFFGSNYSDKVLQINFAFDRLTEEQIRRIQNIFSPKKEVKDFYYAEQPYKVWRVKINAPVTLSTLCFDEDALHRYYKGTGTISLQAFTPFARERMKYLDEYVEEFKKIAKFRGWVPEEAEIWVKEWADGSRLLWNKKDPEGYYDYDTTVPEDYPDEYLATPGIFRCWNAGDFDTNYMLNFYSTEEINTGKEYNLSIKCNSVPGGNDYGEIRIKGLYLVGNDKGFRINSKLNLIEGIDSNGEPTGTVYNQYKTSGDFFKLKQGENWIIIDDYYGEWIRSKRLNDTVIINNNDEKQIKDFRIIEFSDKDLLSGLKGSEFDCEYHNLYL